MKHLGILQIWLVLIIAGASVQKFYAQTPGVECGCDTIGSYVAPASKAIKVEEGASLQEGTSPSGKYTLEAQSATYPNLSNVTIRYESNTILSVTSRAAGWGFSPDDDKFVMHGMTTGGQHWVALYDLNPDPSVTGEDAELVKQTTPTFLTSASVRFSPHGKYLLYAGLGNSSALMLYVYDTNTGDVAHSAVGGAPIVGYPSGKSIAGWGFSPDVMDRTFIHAFLTDVEKYALIAINLETGEDVIRSTNNTGIASFRFSLCGDYFLWSRKEGTADRNCYFYKTSETNISADEHFSGVELESVRTDANHHIVKFFNDNNEYSFENTAHNPCDDEDPPTWPGGASLTAPDATGTTIDLHWDAAIDPFGIPRYSLLQDGIEILEIEDTSYQVTGLEPLQTYDFKVEAGDATGNWTIDGPSTTISTEADLSPVWEVGSWLAAQDVEGIKLTLNWYGVSDDWGITSFKIYRNGEPAGEADGDTASFLVTGLIPEDVDTFKVEAGDAAGQWTIDGPQLILSTAPDNAPFWSGSDQIYADELTETSIAFHWDTASDDWGVTKYRVSRGVTELVVLSDHVTEFLDEELEGGSTYTYSIEAGDEAGNWGSPLTAELLTIPSHVVLPLTVASGYQGLPDIDDRLVVWQDNRNGNADIFNFNLKTDTEDDLITDPEWQGQPKTSEGRIVWADNRNGNNDIFMYDMYDPFHQVVAICEASGDQLTPVIDGNTVVWADYRSGNWDIYMLDLLTMEEKAVCTNSSSQVAPDVSGNVIVWEDARHGNPDIYGYYISTEREFEVCRHGDEQRNPAVEVVPEYRIFWQDNRNGNWDIYMRLWFVSSFENIKVYLGYSGDQINPDIDDEVLVYQDDQNGSWDIYAYNFYNQFYGNIEPICLEAGDQMNPRTSKGRIVWEDRRNDDGDIYIWDRPPGTDLSLTLKESIDPIAIGKTLVLELTAHNNGPDDEDSAKVVCKLPVAAQLSDTAATAGSLEKTGLELTWYIGSLPADSSEVLKVHLKTYDLAVLHFRAAIEGAGFDPDPSNNRLSETTEVKLVAGEILGKGYAPSLFAEEYGNVHIAYGSDDSLVYANKILHSAWNIEYLDTVNNYHNGDILKDSDGNLHFSYSDKYYESFPDSRLYYMTNKNQGFWKNRIIALSDSGFSSISMDVNKQGSIHMMYQQAPGMAFNGPFKYMNNRSGTWSYPEMFCEEGYDHIDMVMDDEGFAHTVFIGLNIGILYQKSQDTIIEEWLPEERIELNWTGGQHEGMVVDIGLDSSGNPHVIYPGGTDGDYEENIKYAYRINDTWHFEEVDDGDFGSAGNAIAVEPPGITHLCYSHFPSNQIRYATNVTGSWIKQTLEKNADTWFSDMDMAVDGYGNVHITYLHEGNVKYALRPPIEFFTVEPDTLDFGIVQVNESKQLYLKLFNKSSERIHIDSVHVLENNGYTMDFIPFTLYKGLTDSIPIHYTPDENMKSNSNLRIWFTSNSSLFVDVPIRGSTPIPELSVNPDPIAFGTIPPYTQEFRTATITNTGSDDLIITEITVEYILFGHVYPTDFDLISDNCTILGPGESCQVEIEFYPMKIGQQRSYLNVISNDPDYPYRQVKISGNGQNPRAQILVRPYTLSFGYVEINETGKDTLSIYNTGDLDLTISNITLTGGNTNQFAFNNSCSTILPGDSCFMTVDFMPTISEDCSATLNIFSNSYYNNPYSISLNGSSALKQLSASDPAVDFGQKMIGEDSMVVVIFTNNGNNDVTISEMSIVGHDLYEFLHTGWSGVLATGESCRDTIWFAPIFPGNKNAVLRVLSNDTDEPVMDIPLTGIVSEGAIALHVSVNAYPETGVPPLMVQFNATVAGGNPPFTYLWDFDDQTGSTDQNPVHTFADVNTYEVHLTLTDANNETVKDSVTIQVVDTLYSISGSILDKDGTSGITAGIVELITEGTLELKGQVLLDGSNEFLFMDVVEGNYTLRFLPDQVSYPDALPTYLGDVLMMFEATFITVDDNIVQQDIHVQNKPGTGSGNGNINGNLVEDDGKKNTTVIIGNSATKGTPVDGIYVYLIDNSDGSLTGFAVTDQEGYFEFVDLPETSYLFIADYMGIPMDNANPLLTISSQDDSISIVATVSSINISTEILATGIHDYLLPAGLDIYPNPARDVLYIRADREIIKEGINRIFLLGVNGSVIISEYFYHSGADDVQISVNHIPAGIYILRLEGKKGFYSARIVIMK